MWVIIKDAPEGYEFMEDKEYQVFGKGLSFVFDENGESVWLYDLSYQTVEED